MNVLGPPGRKKSSIAIGSFLTAKQFPCLVGWRGKPATQGQLDLRGARDRLRERPPTKRRQV